jgi:hypothetical protein
MLKLKSYHSYNHINYNFVNINIIMLISMGVVIKRDTTNAIHKY